MSIDPVTGSPDSPRASASSVVYADLRRRIVSIDLPPDTTLDRNEIAATYGVSRSPVRDAILRLEQDRLVASFPQSRTVVTRIDLSRITEEHFLRVSLECETVHRIAENPERAAVARLRGLLRVQEAISDDVDQSALFKQLDESFHEALFDIAGQPGLYRHTISNTGNLARVRSLDLPRPEKMRAVYEGHARIVDALEAGDQAGATSAMREHLSGTIARIPEIQEQYRNLFS